MYALNLDSDGRCLSATFAEYAPQNWPRVLSLPDGNLTDYLYQEGQYVYSPFPDPGPQPPELTLEERINDLEIALCEIMGSDT